MELVVLFDGVPVMSATFELDVDDDDIVEVSEQLWYENNYNTNLIQQLMGA